MDIYYYLSENCMINYLLDFCKSTGREHLGTGIYILLMQLILDNDSLIGLYLVCLCDHGLF